MRPGGHVELRGTAIVQFQGGWCPSTSLVQDDYRIGPQDTLEIAVFQVPDLSKTIRVDSGGTILLPLIGQMTASGRTSKQLSDELANEFGKRYMNDPLVTVTVRSPPVRE